MVSSEVKRTLVKSPPELWAELSDAASLARHLGELGDMDELSITQLEAERRVEWQAGALSGTVLIEASGWGTKVTLSVERELELPGREAGATPQAARDEVSQAAGPGIEPAREELPADELAGNEPADGQASDELSGDERAGVEPAGDEPAEPAGDELTGDSAASDSPEPRRGFFARLFGRRLRRAGKREKRSPAQGLDTAPVQAVDSPAPDAERQSPPVGALSTEGASTTEPAPATDPATATESSPATAAAASAEEPPVRTEAVAPDISQELRAAEEVAAVEVTAVLTAALDRLGAAHHRPFSRA